MVEEYKVRLVLNVILEQWRNSPAFSSVYSSVCATQIYQQPVVLPFPFLDIDSNVFPGPTLCLPTGGDPSNTAVDVYPLVFLWAWSHCSRTVTWVGWQSRGGWKICKKADYNPTMLSIDYLVYKTPGTYESIQMFLSPSISWVSLLSSLLNFIMMWIIIPQEQVNTWKVICTWQD